MASFTGVGDTVTLSVSDKEEKVSVALSGTYSMTIALQKEVGSPGSGMWEEIERWSTDDATVAYDYFTTDYGEELRLIVLVDTSGTCTATLTNAADEEITENEVSDNVGNVLLKFTQEGPLIPSGKNVQFEGGRLVNIGDNTTYTALAANSGKPHVIPDLTGDLVISLPTAAADLDFEFIYAGVAADVQDWQIDTGSDTNFFLGGVVHLDTDAGSAGDEVVPIASDGNSNSKLNVLVPHVGTRVRVICDGTNWYLSGQVVGATAPTFADQ